MPRLLAQSVCAGIREHVDTVIAYDLPDLAWTTAAAGYVRWVEVACANPLACLESGTTGTSRSEGERASTRSTSPGASAGVDLGA